MMIRTCVKALLGFALLFPVVSAASEEPSPSDKGATLTQEQVDELEEKLRRVLDENELLLENLVGCAQELEELRQESARLKASRSTDTEGKSHLIDQIEKSLETQNDLGFLERLEKDQLRVLLNIIRQALH